MNDQTKSQAQEAAKDKFLNDFQPGQLADMTAPDYVEIPKDEAEDNRPFWEIDPRFLNPYEEPMENPTWLKIGGRPAFPKLGLITIEAKPKQGKSFCAYGISIPIISGRQFDTATPTEKPRLIICFDAEMSKISLLPRYKAIRASIGEADADNFRIVPMLAVPMKDRWSMIEEMTAQYDPQIVIIDHIGKFYGNANDQEESNRITAYLEKLKAERTAIVISHVTTGDNTKMYGAVGTKLDNEQCERYCATCTNGVYELKAISARDTSTDNAAPFRFAVRIDGDHNPTEFIDATAIYQKAHEQEVSGWRNNFERIFGDDSTLRNTEIIERIMKQDQLEKRAAQNKLTKAKEMGVIRKISGDRYAPYELTPVGV